eukprot:7904359-Alexandrium_andersonii.AAC.1
MSASLVGSEMCIRDRPNNVTPRAAPAALAAPAAPDWQRRQAEKRDTNSRRIFRARRDGQHRCLPAALVL